MTNAPAALAALDYFALASEDDDTRIVAMFRRPAGSRYFTSVARPIGFEERDGADLLAALQRAQRLGADVPLRSITADEYRAIKADWDATAEADGTSALQGGARQALAAVGDRDNALAVGASLDHGSTPGAQEIASLLVSEATLSQVNYALREELMIAAAYRPEVTAAIAVQLNDEADWEAIAKWCGGTISEQGAPDGETYFTLHVPSASQDAWNGAWIVRDLTGAFEVVTGVDEPTPGVLQASFLASTKAAGIVADRTGLADLVPLSLLDGRDHRVNAFEVADEIIGAGWLPPTTAASLTASWAEAQASRDALSAEVTRLRAQLAARDGDTETPAAA